MREHSKDDLIYNEHNYFFNDSEKLKYVKCPNCKEINCLYVGYFSIGCRECALMFDIKDFEK